MVKKLLDKSATVKIIHAKHSYIYIYKYKHMYTWWKHKLQEIP